MISFSNPQGAVFLANLNVTEAANEKIQEQISSGLTIASPEDGPDQITQLLQLEANQAKNTQVQTNLTNTQTIASSADQALTSVLQTVDQANSAAATGVSSTSDAQTRQILAQQVQTYLTQIVSLSQTAVGGRFVFGGDSDQTPSYQLDSSSANGVDQLSTGSATSLAEDSSGLLFQSGLTAQQIFDPRNSDGSFASGNLFAAMQSLYTALNNNDTAGIANAQASLSQAATYVNAQQGFYGAVQNRLTLALTTASNTSTSLAQQISDLRETDLSQALTQLTQGQTQLQSSLAAESKSPQTSLFNYLG
jgi:flagellar hook-associated protein 3 FlgL